MNSPGLRERKKQKTRWAIQEHAMRLFAEQGYDATTVDQIAAAAEISPSTFFRYFRTKEDVVVQDEYDDLLVEGIKAVPLDLPPLSAMREAMRRAFAAMTPAEFEKVRERAKMILTVPALRARTLENFMDTIALLANVVAERTGRTPDDLEVRTAAGAIVGAMVAVFERWALAGGPHELPELVERIMTQLENGLRL